MTIKSSQKGGQDEGRQKVGQFRILTTGQKEVIPTVKD